MYLLNFTPVQDVILPLVMRTFSHFCWRCDQSLTLATKYMSYWFITVTGSYLLYHYFERPMTSLREKWHRPGKGAVTAFADPYSKASNHAANGAGVSFIQ